MCLYICVYILNFSQRIRLKATNFFVGDVGVQDVIDIYFFFFFFFFPWPIRAGFWGVGRRGKDFTTDVRIQTTMLYKHTLIEVSNIVPKPH